MDQAIRRSSEMRYLRFKELRERVPLGRTTMWRMMREGRFPKEQEDRKVATAWLEEEIDEWIKKCAALRLSQGVQNQILGG
jgi:prophage regulatory protein